MLLTLRVIVDRQRRHGVCLWVNRILPRKMFSMTLFGFCYLYSSIVVYIFIVIIIHLKTYIIIVTYTYCVCISMTSYLLNNELLTRSWIYIIEVCIFWLLYTVYLSSYYFTIMSLMLVRVNVHRYLFLYYFFFSFSVVIFRDKLTNAFNIKFKLKWYTLHSYAPLHQAFWTHASAFFKK